MNNVHIVRLVRLFLILVVQIFLLNNLYLWGYATPLFIGYMITSFHRGSSRIILLLWGFLTGLLYDMFSNTAGIGAASCTLLAMAQPHLLSAFAPRDAADEFVASTRVMGAWRFISYLFVSFFVLHFSFYLLDAFVLSDILLTVISTIVGTIFTTVLVFFTDMIVRGNKR
jgi:rod shape-determining protein MreD